MAALIDIMSKVENCGGSEVNTGKLGCLQFFGTPLSIIRTKIGFVIPKETELNLAYLETQVQNGNLSPIMEASAFEDVSGSDTFSTSASGVERLNLKGLPKYKLTYEEGHEFYRQMYKLSSFKSGGAILIDEEGRWLFGVNSDGDYVGMSLGQVNAEMRKTKVQGGDAESKSITMQFIDRYQWDYSYGIVERESLGFSPLEVPTVNGVKLDYADIPVALATTIKIKAVLASDNKSVVEGLVAANFLVTKAGTTEVPSASVESPAGTYTLTVTALAAGTVLVDLYDSALNLNVVINSSVLYRSDAVSIVVA